MTKKKLEKEAEEYARDTYEMCSYQGLPYASDRRARQQAFLAGAEPREKQIQIDAEQIRALQKQNGELTDRVKELEAQIEKMKCCANCEYTPPFDKHCDNCIQGSIKLRYINWQLRR